MTRVARNRMIYKVLVGIGTAMAITTGCGMWAHKTQMHLLSKKQEDAQVVRMFVPDKAKAQQVPTAVVITERVLSVKQMDSIRRVTVAAFSESDVVTNNKLDSITLKLDKLMQIRKRSGTTLDSMFRVAQKERDLIITQLRQQNTLLRKDAIIKSDTIIRNIYQQNKIQSVLEFIAAVVIAFATLILWRNIYLTSPAKIKAARTNA